MSEDGKERTKALPGAILGLDSVSPDGNWVIVMREIQEDKDVSFGTQAVPVGGGDPVTVCRGFCAAGWTPNARFFVLYSLITDGGKTVLIPVSPEKGLPSFPVGGTRLEGDVENVGGARVLTGFVDAVFSPELYASWRSSVHRNLYRIPLQ